MNTRNAKSVVVTFFLVMIVAISLMTSQSANRPANVPVADSTSPQPLATGTSSYAPRSEPSIIELPSQPVPQQVVDQFAPNTKQEEYGTVVEGIESLDSILLYETAQELLIESSVVV